MSTVFQRMRQLIAPLGRGKRALSRLLRRPRSAPLRRAADTPPTVTCVLLVEGDVAGAAARCRQLLQQTWRPLEILLVGDAVELARLPDSPDVRLLPLLRPDRRSEELIRELQQLAGDFLLIVGQSTNGGKHRLAEMVAELESDCRRQQWHNGSGVDRWSLHRNRSIATVRQFSGEAPVYDAVDVDSEKSLPLAAGKAMAMRFGSEADLPYRLRAWLAEPHVQPLTDDSMTAERLALLAPPATEPAAVRQLRPSRVQHIVLQADNFTEGGMEQVIIDLADALTAEGFTTSLLILGKRGTAAERARDQGLTVVELPPDPAAYAAYLEQCGAALVNAHYSTFGADTCAQRGVPFVQTMHNMYMWFGPPQVDAYRAADPHTRAYVCVSNNVARYADIAIGLSPSRMLVIPNGCNDGFRPQAGHREAAAELRAELGLQPDDQVLLNIASIQPPKAQHLLVNAFAQIATECPRAQLVVLGSPADEAYARRQRSAVQRLGLEQRVHWVGQRRDVSAFHQLAVALVQPSFFEGWSLAITEAVLAELPVVATDVGGALEQLRGTDGVLLPSAATDVTAVDCDRLIPMLDADYPDLERCLADAMRSVLARGGARSRMPADWRSLLRGTAYRRCAAVFHWLIAGGSAASARYWLRPEAEAEPTPAAAEVPA